MMIARFLARRRRLRTRLLTMTRLRRMRAILPGIEAQRFPRWLPLALHWKPASRRASPTVPRAQTVSHLHLMATHLHAQLQVFAGGVLTRTIACARAHLAPERIFRSMAGSAPLPWRRSGQRDALKAPSMRSSVRELRAPLSGAQAPIALRSASRREETPHHAFLTSPELRRPGAEQAVSRGLRGKPLPAMPKSTSRPSIARVDGLWPHDARVERAHVGAVQRQESEPPPRMTPAPAFSHTPELIWRKDSPSRRHAVQDAASSEPQVAGRPATTTAAGTTVVQSPSRPDRPPVRRPLSLSDLEPSFVDRLAEDVIRRVERHARIERERRGL